MQALATLAAVLGCVVISNAQYYEANDLMDDLYKRLAQLDSQYYMDEPWESDDIQLDDRAADIRDPEFLQHGAGNNVDGFQYISGTIRGGKVGRGGWEWIVVTPLSFGGGGG